VNHLPQAGEWQYLHNLAFNSEHSERISVDISADLQSCCK